MYDKYSLSHFIKSVASSNLETFHSKAIVWLLNTIKDSNHKIFTHISKNSNVPEGAQHIKSIAEFNSHDLISLFQAEDKYHLVFWENKIKADFHFKKIDTSKRKKSLSNETYYEKLSKIEDYQNWLNRGLSQPYYYQVRHHLNCLLDDSTWLNELSENLVYENTLTKDNVDFHWIILSTYTEAELDTFHHGTWNGYYFKTRNEHSLRGDKNFVKNLNFLGYSDWKYFTYQSLFKDLESDLSEIQLAYVSYVSGSEVFAKLYNKDTWTLEELMSVHEKLEGGKNRYAYKWNIAGSANAPSPLLNICFTLEKFMGKYGHSTLPEFQKTLKYTKICDAEGLNTEVDRITCNVQLQGKAIKIQFSHWDYDNVTLAKKDPDRGLDYAKAIFHYISPESKILDTSSLKETLIKWLRPYRIEVSRINLPTTKTGLSFSLKASEKDKINQVINLCEALESLTKTYEI